MKRFVAGATIGMLLAGGACAENVSLAGVLGGKALLVINGAQPALVKPGQKRDGVRLISVSGDTATIESGGERKRLRVGEAPLNVGDKESSTSDKEIVLTAGTNGHYTSLGGINGRSVRFMVDTGASAVVVSQDRARRLGVKLDPTKRVRVNTANGVTLGYSVVFDEVSLGSIKVRNVEGYIIPANMQFALLGNSFLKRFDIKQSAGQLTLERRY
ncbi:retropepsin-like aspartic protease [Hydrogenophaga sp. 5NK40-0174]|uniref:retropepsin-like aspartic protease family protein n=1 Tax=Hydrogenophaga sp. 5NK40-0174 TaxID=3127649 RepID=UPI00310C1681